MALVKVTEVKDWIKIAGSDDDAVITQILDSALNRVEEYLNFTLETNTYTAEKYDGTGTNKLVLYQFPVTSITTLEVYDGLDSDGAEVWDTWAQNTDYDRLVVVKGGGYIYLDGAWFPYGNQNIRMTYVAGWSTTTVPEKIIKAILDLCYIYYHAIRSDKSLNKTSDVRQIGSGSSTITYDTEAEKKILESIASFKIWNV